MTRTVNALLAVGLIGAAGVAAWHLTGTGRPLAAAAAARSYAGSHAAPEFPTGMDWINTGGETLSLARFKGKVVLLDFWTYGCANCMHVIPDLERLERKYAAELVVIGVHSAKFPNEGRTAQIRKIVQRYGLQHAVLNDQYMRVWDSYGVNAWPTFALIDPAGNAVGTVAGEGHHDLLDEVIGGLVAEFRAKGQLDERPYVARPDPLPRSALLFPGKLVVHQGLLYIADAGHHRIVVADLAGKVRRVIGSGTRGFADGAAGRARFFGPQGLAVGDGALFVADERNNALRRVDLASGAVTTLAGTGAHGYLRGASHPKDTPLNTPWDLLFHGGQLYVAMAGQHQLWRVDPRSGALALHAGTGREALIDGDLAAGALNQPSGLTTDGARLFFADAEASAIRTADFAPDGKLATLVGTGLFDFGDLDGVGDAVRLQHALGVAWHAGRVLIADTYNGKLKSLDPATRRVTTLAGGFDEPGGLAVAGDAVFIADTNHHAIKRYDLATRKVSELTLADPDGLLAAAR
jgi:thiol-disulfide isomerase/thioredoxin